MPCHTMLYCAVAQYYTHDVAKVHIPCRNPGSSRGPSHPQSSGLPLLVATGDYLTRPGYQNGWLLKRERPRATQNILCRDPGSNRKPSDLQSDALPTELSRLVAIFDYIMVQDTHVHLMHMPRRLGRKRLSARLQLLCRGPGSNRDARCSNENPAISTNIATTATTSNACNAIGVLSRKRPRATQNILCRDPGSNRGPSDLTPDVQTKILPLVQILLLLLLSIISVVPWKY